MAKSIMMISTAGLLAMALPACTYGAAKDVPMTDGYPFAKCDADPAQSFIEKKADVANGTEIVRLTKASTMRWIGPRTPVTMDLRIERVNIMYDDSMMITQISCG